MNQKIKFLDYSKLLFVDVETVKGCNDFSESHPFYSVWAWKFRNKETNILLTEEENVKLYNDKAALNAEWGKIVCISVGFIHNEELHIKSFTGDEKDILINFKNLVVSTGRMIAGHNVVNFDVPYIRKRWVINKLGDYLSDKQGNDVYIKPWLLDDCVFDTMVAWKGTGFANSSLEELSMAFEIPASKGNCHGNEVSDFYYSGRLDEIKTYCEKDVAVVANILRFWKGDSILEPIIRDDSDKKEVILEKSPILVRVYNNKGFTEEDKAELEALLLSIEPSEEDKVNLKKIILAHYQAKSDKVAVKKQKEIEVNGFVDGLYEQ